MTWSLDDPGCSWWLCGPGCGWVTWSLDDTGCSLGRWALVTWSLHWMKDEFFHVCGHQNCQCWMVYFTLVVTLVVHMRLPQYRFVGLYRAIILPHSPSVLDCGAVSTAVGSKLFGLWGRSRLIFRHSHFKLTWGGGVMLIKSDSYHWLD